jgi:hypothetical protein
MKTLLHKVISVQFLGTLFLSFGASQMLVLPVLADELINISDVKGCRAIEGEAERLACYDTVSGGGIFNEQKLKQVQVEEFGSARMKPVPQPKAEPAPVVATDPGAAATQETAPAKEASPIPATGKATSVDRISVTIVRSKKDKLNIYYFQTASGQVWKQQEAVSWNIKPPFDAEIKAGVLGSFFLVYGGDVSTRVKRVR